MPWSGKGQVLEQEMLCLAGHSGFSCQDGTCCDESPSSHALYGRAAAAAQAMHTQQLHLCAHAALGVGVLHQTGF